MNYLQQKLNSKLYLALINYAHALCVTLAVLAITFFLGQSSELILLKVLISPVFWLAFYGLEKIYQYPIFEPRVSIRAVEYSVLYAFLMSVFVLLIVWQQQFEIRDIVAGLLAGIIVGAVARLLLGIREAVANTKLQ